LGAGQFNRINTMLTIDRIALTVDAVDAAKTYLRVDCDEEDASIGALVTAAIVHAEGYLGQLLIERDVVERLPASTSWQRLAATPVRGVNGVTGIPAEGAGFALATDAYLLDINQHQDGWLRMVQQGSAGRVDVAYRAGMVSGWPNLPEAVSMAVLRIAAHLHAHRDAPDDQGPPPAIASLLRPWRRMRL
jgi:uncharacterized phiE125 gp8 family phage protein